MPPLAAPLPGKPYCNNCNYDLTGATETPVCPECGKPLVEVLVRGRMNISRKGRRYRSESLLFGLPIIDIALGPDPDSDELLGHARGIIAVGDRATGLLVFAHQRAIGVVAVGGTAIGGVAFGGASLGVVAIGGGAAGGFALGGGTAGIIAIGGAAVGFMAQGGGAVGYYARGGGAVGVHTVSGRGPSSPHATAAFDRMTWLIGTPGSPLSLLTPLAHAATVALAVTAVLCLIALYGHLRASHRRPS